MISVFYVISIVSLNITFQFYFKIETRRDKSAQSQTNDKQMRWLQTLHKLAELYYVIYRNERYTVFFLSNTTGL